MKTPNKVLREYRQKNKLHSDELAKKLGIAPSTLRSLENGTRRITPERAIEIEQALNGAIKRERLLPEIFLRRAAA